MTKILFNTFIVFITLSILQQSVTALPDSTEKEFLTLLKQEREWRKNNNLPYYPFPYDSYLADSPEDVEKVDDIIKYYKRFLHKHPYHVEASRQLAVLFTDLNNIGLAEQQWLKTVSLCKDDDRIFNECGIFFSDNFFQPLIAARMFSKAIKFNPQIADYYSNLALVYFSGRHEICTEYKWTLPEIFKKILLLYDKARKLEPENYINARDYAQNFIMADQFNVQVDPKEEIEAWKYCFNTRTSNKELSYIYLQLARIYRKLDDKDNIKRCIDKSLLYDPNNKIAMKMQNDLK